MVRLLGSLSNNVKQIIRRISEGGSIMLGELFNIRKIGYDRWNATMIVQFLEDDSFNMVSFGEGFRDMSPPTKELMRIVLERKQKLGGPPVFRWNVDNAFGAPILPEIRKTTKKKPRKGKRCGRAKCPKPRRPYRHPGCPGFCEQGQVLCKDHMMWSSDRLRICADDRGYDSRCQKARKLFLQQYPLCVLCQVKGKNVAATGGSHHSASGDQRLFWDEKMETAL